MVASIASLRGYDIKQPEIRSAVLLTLVGADADDLLKKAGVASTGRLANLAAQRLPGPAMMVVNKAVGFRLLSTAGKKTLTRFGKGVPVIGGVVGAGLDSYLLKKIADHARHEFPPRATGLLSRGLGGTARESHPSERSAGTTLGITAGYPGRLHRVRASWRPGARSRQVTMAMNRFGALRTIATAVRTATRPGSPGVGERLMSLPRLFRGHLPRRVCRDHPRAAADGPRGGRLRRLARST